MSSHATPARHWPLLLLAVLVGCATTGRTGTSRGKDHVFFGTRDELAAGVTRVFEERGLKLVQAAPDTLQTPWVAVNLPQTVDSYTDVTDRTTVSVLYESYRVTIVEVDQNHHRLRVERGTASSLLSADNARRLNPASEQSSAPSPRRGDAAQLAPPPGTTAPEFVQDEELEWALVQSLDPTGAGAIAQEEAAVNGGGVDAPAPTPPAPPPPALVEVARGCPDVAGADALLAAHRLVLLGEIHGTAQAPQFLGALACRAAARGMPLAIGLELPHQGNAALEVYLASEGTAQDRQAYLNTETWQRDWHDGRSAKRCSR